MVICNQIMLLFLNYVSYRLVILLKTINAIQVRNIIFFRVSLRLINFSFQNFPIFVPEISTNFMSFVVQIVYISSVWTL